MFYGCFNSRYVSICKVRTKVLIFLKKKTNNLYVKQLNFYFTSINSAKIFHYIFCATNPIYTIFGGLYFILRVQLVRAYGVDTGEATIDDYLTWDANITVIFICQLLHIVLITAALYYLDIYRRGKTHRDIQYDVPKSNVIV